MAAAATTSAAAVAARPPSFNPPSRALSIRIPYGVPKPLPLALCIRQNLGGESTPESRILCASYRFRPPTFRVSAYVAESDQKIISGDDENISREDVIQKDFPDIKALIQAYKKAIIGGDQNSIDEIERAIYDLKKKNNDLYKKFGKMNAEIGSSKDKLLRVKADFENHRKKSDQDRATFTSDIKFDVVESLLPLIDSFEKTKRDMKPETEKEKKIETSYQGIYKQFVEVMRSMRMSVVETVGKPFDPTIHEAVAREESHQYKAGIVSQEISRGFLLGDQVLRTATVKVSSGPGPVKTDSASDKSSQQQGVTEAVPHTSPNTNYS